MGQLYTHGTWHVKAGHEDEFVAAWTEFVDWTQTFLPHAGATLMQDRDDPSRFVSFGPWRSVDEVQLWRAETGFQERLAQLRELLESFDPQLMEVVAERR